MRLAFGPRILLRGPSLFNNWNYAPAFCTQTTTFRKLHIEKSYFRATFDSQKSRLLCFAIRKPDEVVNSFFPLHLPKSICVYIYPAPVIGLNQSKTPAKQIPYALLVEFPRLNVGRLLRQLHQHSHLHNCDGKSSFADKSSRAV